MFEPKSDRFDKIRDFMIEHAPKMPIMRGCIDDDLFVEFPARSKIILYIWTAEAFEHGLLWGFLTFTYENQERFPSRFPHQLDSITFNEFYSSEDSTSELDKTISLVMFSDASSTSDSFQEPKQIKGFNTDPCHYLMLHVFLMIEKYLWDEVCELKRVMGSFDTILSMEIMYTRVTRYRAIQQSMIEKPFTFKRY